MQFSFVCPIHGKIFESDDFRIVENRGVMVDDNGSKTLDAKAALNAPCPYCGQRHVYHASELACPFMGNNKF